MSHPVKRSRGCEACLVEVVGAVSLDIAFAVLAERGSCPSVVVVLGIEDVVQRHAEGDILQTEAGQGKVIAQVHVGIEMCFEEHVHVLVEAAVLIIVLITVEVGVGQILFADVLALDAGVETFIIERKDVVEDEVGREGGVGVAETDCRSVFECHRPVLADVA